MSPPLAFSEAASFITLSSFLAPSPAPAVPETSPLSLERWRTVGLGLPPTQAHALIGQGKPLPLLEAQTLHP